MSLYGAANEERLRAGARVREWARSGLLEARQAAAIQDGLRTELKRTNRYLRIGLFVFGTIVVWAALGFWLVALKVRQDSVMGWSAIGLGLACFVLAQYVAARFQLYRFGVEEAFATWSVVLLAAGSAYLTSIGGSYGDLPMLVACVVGAIASAGVYLRLGYLYAALASVGWMAFAAFFLGLPKAGARVLSACIFLAIFVLARSRRRALDEDFPGDDFGAIESVAWFGVYAVLNLRLSLALTLLSSAASEEFSSVFYWATYALIWILPAIGFTLAVRDKHRPMLWANGVMALATLATNKPYLGWERHTWDPILLGVVMAATAVAVRRWLSRGPGGHRHGFTPQSILMADRDALSALSALAGAAQPFAARPPTEATTFDAGRGGRSGGGGGGADF